jgi:hypothetical protein
MTYSDPIICRLPELPEEVLAPTSGPDVLQAQAQSGGGQVGFLMRLVRASPVRVKLRRVLAGVSLRLLALSNCLWD